MAKRSKSSAAWLARQRRDPFVGRAVSRAHFKLAQLDARFGLTAPSRSVLELGAAPGGWTAYLAPRCRRVVACDLAPLQTLPAEVCFIEGDVQDEAVQGRIAAALGGGADLVLSDMAPNLSGNRTVDQARAQALAECATDVALRYLRPGGRFVVKLFHGAGFDAVLRDLRERFAHVAIAKPPASRAASREAYAVATLRVK